MFNHANFSYSSQYISSAYLQFLVCQENKEKAVPVIQLNGIRLLAALIVAANKPELVDMILPHFIENLEEGDASTPSLLRLQVWNFASFHYHPSRSIIRSFCKL